MRLRSVVLPLLVINIAMYVLQFALGNWFTELFLVHRGDLLAAPYTLLTSMFLHGGLDHILFNMYVLFMFGPLLESKIGPKRFLLIYLASGLIAGIASSFVYERALGASGAIMGMMGVIIVLLPRLQVLFFFVIPMPLWIAGIIIALIDLMGVFTPGGGIANAAHLAGMACGLIYGFYLKDRRKKFQRRFSSRSTMDEGDIEQYLEHGRI